MCNGGIGGGPNVLPSPSYVFPQEVVFLADERSTDSSTNVRVGARAIDISLYPATIGALVRTVKFVADLDIIGTPTNSEASLYNLTDGEAVTSTTLTHDTSTNTEKTSVALTVGAAAGNIRSDHVAQYVAYQKMNGGVVGPDQAFCTNARIVVSYA